MRERERERERERKEERERGQASNQSARLQKIRTVIE